MALILLASAAVGVVVGYRRAWLLGWLGAVVGAALLVASRFASNDGINGSEDLSWRVGLVWLGVLLALGFYVGLIVGAMIGAAARHRSATS